MASTWPEINGFLLYWDFKIIYTLLNVWQSSIFNKIIILILKTAFFVPLFLFLLPSWIQKWEPRLLSWGLLASFTRWKHHSIFSYSDSMSRIIEISNKLLSVVRKWYSGRSICLSISCLSCCILLHFIKEFFLIIKLTEMSLFLEMINVHICI